MKSNVRRFVFPLAAAALGLLALSGCCAAYVKALYGEKVVFCKGSPVTFPDFQITFIGDRQQPVPVAKKSIIVHDFEAVAGAEKKTVTWSPGMGLIAPARFQLTGKKFLLELKRSARLGPLKDDEMVIIEDL